MENAIRELRYYCESSKPAGALLLTGEWGCGKTYLVKVKLREELKKTCIICHISLFGIDSMECLKKAVIQAWLDGYCREFGIDREVKAIQKSGQLLKQLPISDSAKELLNFDPASILVAGNSIKGKNVILVFDDLERTGLDTGEILGCVNNYCENLGFHIIIIANEEKIAKQNPQGTAEGRSASSQISYEEIKEKAIQKTVWYEPDYGKIITSILKDVEFKDAVWDYRAFLLANKQNLVNLFNGGGNGGKTANIHNIRCFKCAIFEFYQLFNILKENETDEIQKYLYSFVAFYMACKSGRINAEEDLSKQVRDIYPHWFDPKYMFRFEKNWIIKGCWNQNLVNETIKSLRERKDARSSADILRMNFILEIDEKDINAGFGEVITLAYNGDLTLNEYVLFILNVYTADRYGYSFREPIDWKNIKKGINKRIRYILRQNSSEEDGTKTTIDDSFLSQDAREAYQMIEAFRNSKAVTIKRNKDYYIKNVSENTFFFWQSCREKKYDMFGKKMAKATAAAFCSGSNQDRCMFSSEFIQLWGDCCRWTEFQKQKSVEGFSQLINLLVGEEAKLLEEGRYICRGITRNFIEEVEKIKESLQNDGGA